MNFTAKVFATVKKIKKGNVLTYKQVAKIAGNQKAYRAVGNILHKNNDPENIPCHRVVKSDFTLANNYAFGGYNAQKKKLISEGIKFKKNKPRAIQYSKE